MAIIASAPVAFSAYTSIAGTSEQIIPVSTSGVIAGLTAGNLYLECPDGNKLSGKRFKVSVGGWLKAHGTSQTVSLGLLWQAYTALGAKTGSPADTFTVAASAVLSPSTFYDFVIEQEFFGDANLGKIVAYLPSVMIMGAAVAISSVTAPLTCPNLNASASWAEPSGQSTGYITPTVGMNLPVIAFCASITNNIASDLVETCALTEFTLSME
jgi:hypothetical protein